MGPPAGVFGAPGWAGPGQWGAGPGFLPGPGPRGAAELVACVTARPVRQGDQASALALCTQPPPVRAKSLLLNSSWVRKWEPLIVWLNSAPALPDVAPKTNAHSSPFSKPLASNHPVAV